MLKLTVAWLGVNSRVEVEVGGGTHWGRRDWEVWQGGNDHIMAYILPLN